MKKYLLFLLLTSISVFAQTVIKVDELDKKLINLTYNDNFNEVKSICDSLIALDKNNPKLYFHYFSADALGIHKIIKDASPEKRDSIRKILADESIQKLENAIKLIEELPETPTNNFYLGSLYGYYSRYAGVNKYWWGAYVNGKKANGIFNDIIKDYPECYDAYLYPGVFEYYAARLSGFTGFIASVLGVSGNRNDGIDKIKLALHKGHMVNPQALLVLLEINTMMEDNPNNAIPFFEKYIKTFPENKRIINWYSNTLLNLVKTEKVKSFITNDSLSLIDNFVKTKYYFLNEEIDSTIKYATLAIWKPTTWKGIVEHTKYFLAYSNWIKNNSDTTNYKSLLNEFYSSLFKLDLENKSESKYIYKLKTLLATRNYPDFRKLINKHPKFNEPYFKAEFNLLQGISLFNQNRFLDSISFFEEAEKSPDKRKETIAQRYLLDIFLNSNIATPKIKDFIERVEETNYSKLVFRLDDLKEKYNLN